MNQQIKKEAEWLYLLLIGIFIAALVSSNLIFKKFFHWNPFGWYNFEISVGILPYPVTFLVTDIISEVYGYKKANQAVKVGLIASVFMMLVVTVATLVPATKWSPVNDLEFVKVFGLTGLAVTASMVAYLVAQFVDIKVFHFWKRKTNGKHLWLRNNFSTITSQFIDTAIVLLLLCLFKEIPWDKFLLLLINGFLFKVIVALLDTPLFYASSFYLKKRFNLKQHEEVSF
ncbi:MAG: hypothetical protein Kow0079_15370 [Vicingaceae bacterium]